MPKIINQLQQVKENPIIAKLIAKYRLNDDVLDYFENKKQLLAFCSSYYSCEDPDKQQKPCQRSINTTLRYIPETKKFQLASVRC